MRPLALVTGAARGIGAAIASALAASGYDLALADREDADPADALRAVRASGARAEFFGFDLAQPQDSARLVDDLFQWGGALTCLVNNAGVAPSVRTDLLELDTADFDRVMAVNLRGTFFLTQRVARRMVEAPAAAPRSIVSISSVSAELASTERAAYCLSKSGLSMLTRLFALRLASAGVGVFEVRPGIVQTAMTQPVAHRYDDRIRNGLVPVGRWGQPDDVAATVAALASGSFRFCTGSVICADGGLSIPRL